MKKITLAFPLLASSKTYATIGLDTSSPAAFRSSVTRMADEAGGWPLPLVGHHEGCRRQLGAHVIAHGPSAVSKTADPCPQEPRPAGRGGPTTLRVARSSTAAR